MREIELLPEWERKFLEENVQDSGQLRTFDTGATRDTTEGKHEPWGFTSALVEQRFCQYMDAHRTQSDGELRDSDNWKKGIPLDAYKHSLSRHIQDLRLILEGFPEQAREQNLETALCAILFNVQGMLHETIKKRMEKLCTGVNPTRGTGCGSRSASSSCSPRSAASPPSYWPRRLLHSVSISRAGRNRTDIHRLGRGCPVHWTTARWRRTSESNRAATGLQSVSRASETCVMVASAGLEPTSPGFGIRRSIQ